MRTLDAKEQEFYDKVMAYLDDTFPDASKRIRESEGTILCHSGDNGVLMRGPFAGYSLHSLIDYAATVHEKKIGYEDERF